MLTLQEINKKMSEINEWSLEGNSISKLFVLSNFKSSLELVNKLGELAEKLNHHPDITISYNQVKLNLTTHYEGGLTEKDFQLAKEIDSIHL